MMRNTTDLDHGNINAQENIGLLYQILSRYWVETKYYDGQDDGITDKPNSI